MGNNINNITIYNSIILAAEKINNNKQHLNEVNFFPVPDNDTGTNLAHLMQRIRRDIELKEDIKEMLKLVSDSAVIGSRGNSGAIFSQFLQGFEEKCPNKSSLEVAELIDCFDSGKTYAYKALNNPMEGTILTAIASFSDSLKKLKNKEMTIEEIFSNSYSALEKTVKNTKHMLESQVKSQREDAGALGFMYFVQGFLTGILGENSEIIYTEDDDILEYSLSEINEEHVVDKYQFCTEILLKNSSQIEKSELQKILEKYGNSMVITENKTYRRVHIHTNTPDEVVETLGTMGDIIEVKADDMILQ